MGTATPLMRSDSLDFAMGVGPMTASAGRQRTPRYPTGESSRFRVISHLQSPLCTDAKSRWNRLEVVCEGPSCQTVEESSEVLEGSVFVGPGTHGDDNGQED